MALPREARQLGAPPGSWLGGRPWRADCLALLATWGWRRTHCTRCARYVQTCGAKLDVEARFARGPKSLRCSAPRKSPGDAPSYRALASPTPLSFSVPNARAGVGSARRRAICARPRAQRSGSGARSAHQHLTRRHLFERSERSERSEFAAADLRSEHRGKSVRQSRPGHHEHGGGPSQRSVATPHLDFRSGHKPTLQTQSFK